MFLLRWQALFVHSFYKRNQKVVEMKSHLKIIIISFVISLITNILSAQQITSVTLQLKWKHQFQFAGYYAAIEKGYYNDVGLKVNLLEATEVQNPDDAVFEGKAEFGVCSSDILLMRSQNKKAVILASVFQHSPQILIASKQSGIRHIHDLAGKRIAIDPNSTEIIAFMNDEGVSLDKCMINQFTYNVDGLTSGKVDAISAYSTNEPFILKQANFDYSIITPLMGGIDFYGDVLFSTESFIINNPSIVANFREASLKGWNYAMHHQEEIAQLIYNKYSKKHSLEHLRFEAEQMNNLIMDDVVEIGYTNPGRWQSITDIYKKLKMLNASFTTEGLFYSDYVKPKTPVHWSLVVLRLMILLIVGSIAYYFYKYSKRLKNEIANRNKAEKILLESEEQYRVIFENNSAAMAIVEPDTTISMINEAYCQMSGYTMQEMIGTSWTQHIPPQDLERLKEFNRRRLIDPNDAPNKYEFAFFHKNGEIKHSLMSVTMLHSNRKIILSLIDITKRIRSEEMLRDSEARYRSILNASPDVITITDLKGHIVMASPAARQIIGCAIPEELIGHSINDIIAPGDRERVLFMIEQMKQGIMTGLCEYKGIRIDGSSIDMEMNTEFIRDAQGNPSQMIFIVRDVCDRKNGEKEKRKADDWLRILSIAIEQSPVTTVITDIAGNIVFVNPKFTETTGYTAEEVMGENPRILKSENRQPSDYKELWETILSGKNWHGVFLNRKKNGEFYWESAVISPVKNKEGIITHFLAVKADISKRILAEQEIKLKNEALVKINAEKDKFFSIIAHDLRSPFNGFLGLTEIMAEELSSLTRDEIQDIAVNMRNSATNLFRLLENLLNWARMQQGLIPFKKEVVKLLPIVIESFEMLEESAKSKAIELTYSIPNDFMVVADNNMLHTIIRNLLSNAVKFTTKGGKVSLSAITLGDRSVEISVKDTGIGMNATIVDNLFSLDVHTNRKGTEGELSTGLGLMLCKEFVEKHGGKIRIESEEGKGSTFYFTIPNKA
jgi:PAS domain S-box-containing protein